MKRKYLILFSLSGLVLSLDQLTKNLIHAHLALNVRYEIVPSFLAVTYSRSIGLVAGTLTRLPESLQEVFLIGIPTVALGLILLIFVKLRATQVLTSFALTFIFAGAVGNLVDRFQRGYVIDFLDFHWKNTPLLPPMNLADLSIICGVILVLGRALRKNKKVEGSVA
jgi:signal peptidase II